MTSILERAEEQCAELEEAMLRLRAAEVPPVEVKGESVHAALLDVRARLDLAEELKVQARRLRRQFRARAAERLRERDEEYDRRLAEYAKGAVRREYESVREREVRARLDVLELTRQANAAADVRARVEEMFESLTDMFFGLLNIREELIARLRELQFETVLERG